MADDAKPFSRSTRITTSVGLIASAVVLVFAAGAWAAAIDGRMQTLVESVDRIESNIDQMRDFNSRLAVLEALIAERIRTP